MSKYKLNEKAVERARALAAAGAIDHGMIFPFSTWDVRAILGDPPDWPRLSEFFLGYDEDVEDVESLERYVFPTVRVSGEAPILSVAALGLIEIQAAMIGAEDIAAAAAGIIRLTATPSFSEDAEAENFEMEIFKVGKFVSGEGVELTADAEFFDDVIQTFREIRDLKKVPLRVGGHELTLFPAVGWVEDLRHDGETLFAEVSNVPKVLRGAFRNKLFRFPSAGFKRAREIGGKVYDTVLDHVAILGGRSPAVYGLADLDAYMNDAEGGVCYFTEVREEGESTMDEKTKKALEEANARAEAAEARATAAEARATEAEAKVASFSEENATLKTKELRTTVESLVDSGVRGGKIAPAVRDEFVAQGMSVASSASFSEDGKNEGLEGFKALIEKMPKLMEFSESTVVGDEDEPAGGVDDFDRDMKKGRDLVRGQSSE